jgi:DNA-binding CsgD family transcriptional regulator
MEFSPVLHFFLGLICSIGYYRLFFSINRPVVRWRFILMLALVILGPPLNSVWMDLNFGPSQKPFIVLAIGLTIDMFALLACVLLGIGRFRALVAASFVLSIINLVEIPVIYYIGAVVYPFLNVSNVIEAAYQFPQLYYCAVIMNNMIVMGCCFLAARWLKKVKISAPKKLSVLFACFFYLFAIITLFWCKDILMIMPISFLASAFFGTLILGMLIMALYFYIRLTVNTETKTPSVNENVNPSNTIPTIAYTQFIPNLTKRELEVIKAVLAGFENQKELAASLHISVNTLKTHLKNIYQTTGVSSIDALSLIFHGYSSNHPSITPKSP